MNTEERNMKDEIRSKNAKIRSFKDLYAWQEGHALVLRVYALTKLFPKTETFGLIDQMRRAAVSVTSNIAEGFARTSIKEKLQFYSIAQGSVTELQNQLLIARDVGYLHNVEYEKADIQSITVHKLVNGLIKGGRRLLGALFLFVLPSMAMLIAPLSSFFLLPPSASAATTFGSALSMPGNSLGIVGHWTFDGGDLIQNAKDSSGQGHNGYLSGFTSTSSAATLGIVGQALAFSGSSQYITTSYSVPAQSSATSFTWSAWMKLNSGNTSTVVILGFRNGATWVKLTPSAFEYGSGSVMTHSIPTGKWVQITIVKSGSNFTYYQNGASITTASNSGSAVSHTFFIGADPGFPADGTFSGSLDDVRVYNRPLSAAEIKQAYQQGSPGGGAQIRGCGFGTLLPNGKCRGFITSTAASNWTVPADWNATGATVEAIGPGGNGGNGRNSGNFAGAGGQGGGYGKVTSPAHISAGDTLTVQIGTGGSTNATFLKDDTSTTLVQGDYGGSATLNTPNNRSQTNTGDVTHNGGDGGLTNTRYGGGGGGGAGGPNGAGAAGAAITAVLVAGAGGGAADGGSVGVAPSGTTNPGGAGGAAFDSTAGGAGGTPTNNPGGAGSHGSGGGGGGPNTVSGTTALNPGGDGGTGINWTTAGSGGGGGGGGGHNASTGINGGNGGNGGLYGGGGGGGASGGVSSPSGLGGSGAQGIIVVTYTSASNSVGSPVSATIGTTQTPPNLATGLVGHWTFDGGDLTLNVKDSSATGNNGHLTGITATSSAVSAGISGQALTFSTSQGVLIPYNSAYNWGSTQSVSAWVYLTQNQQQWARVFKQSSCCGTGVNLEINSTNKPQVQISGSQVTSSNALQLNRWYLLTETYDGATAKIYVNGALDKSQSVTGAITDYNDTLILAKGAGGTEQFVGSIDDVRLYNRALSATEVKQLYALGR